MAAIARAWQTSVPEAAARLDFESLDAAWSLLTAKRRAILRAMAGQGPLSIRAIARRVGGDVHAVHTDVRVLHRSGVIDRTEDGRMVLPYEVIRLDFTFTPKSAA
ncbi:MAG: helix-turn-helix domain-containing protein [Proteobacteria bacterium]|nr:helix-turn-helix domain-containing protein [Pseudomonadota bacterium]